MLQGVKGKKNSFVRGLEVNAMMNDMDCHQWIGTQDSRNTFAMALSTVEKMHREQAIQPHLAWTPLDVIRKNIVNTTQWVKRLT